MSSSQGTEANNPKSPQAGASLSLEELGFISSILFLIGSCISVYTAYKSLTNSISTQTIE
ncbi:hypothetical protein ACUL41_01490 [Virgibacillus natechei]